MLVWPWCADPAGHSLRARALNVVDHQQDYGILSVYLTFKDIQQALGHRSCLRVPYLNNWWQLPQCSMESSTVCGQNLETTSNTAMAKLLILTVKLLAELDSMCTKAGETACKIGSCMCQNQENHLSYLHQEHSLLHTLRFVSNIEPGEPKSGV